MSAALAPPFIVAALVVCVSGAMKLRPSGVPMRMRMRPAGVTMRVRMRVLAVGELALGTACAVHPTTALALALAVAYGAFAVVAVVLWRRREACECFGESDAPVSAGHVVASATLGALVLAAALAGPNGLGWVFGQRAPDAVALLIGIAGAAYAVVLVYTVVPRAWGAWERA